MLKDPNIYLKLEVTRDKISGDLNIIAHFDLNAPNVFLDEKGYFWLPTEEEKDLLGDSFELMPSAKTKPSLEKIEIQSTPRPEIQQRTESIKPTQSVPTSEIKQKPVSESLFELEKKEKPWPPLEKPNDEATFEIIENVISDEIEQKEETKAENTEVNIEEDEGMIVKADSDAIEKALKRHIEEKDGSMVEADEKTIVDKVLKQKKKWKK